MNVKELILSQPAAGIAAALVDRLDIEPGKSSMTLSTKRRNWTNSCRRNGRNTSSLRRRSLPDWVSLNLPRKNGRKRIGRCAGRCLSTV